MIFTTLAAVKRYLGISGASPSDDLLTSLITTVSAGMAAYMNRDLETGPRVMWVDGTGGQRMVFNDTPVRSVELVKVDGQPIRQAAMYGDYGYMFDETRILLNGVNFTRGHGNVEILYTAGYDTPPPELEQVCIETVALRFKERDWTGFNSKSLAGETVSFDKRSFSPSAVAVLNTYKRTFLV